MGHDSYWYRYLMARHHAALIVGTVLLAMALISTLSGKCLARYGGTHNRADDPKRFWWNVALYYLLGLTFLGFYLYTAN